jgi:hypothetical protein
VLGDELLRRGLLGRGGGQRFDSEIRYITHPNLGKTWPD